MITLTINNKPFSVRDDMKLLPFLRDVCHLKSVKDGCSEGACGTCHVLIDGKATKACIPMISQLEGKSILTVEGLSSYEKEIYVYAFGKAGAVQCGFCIPGMIISAKSLLDKNPQPTRDEVAFAIRNNLCRCTGYKKIIDGILIAADLLHGHTPVPEEDFSWQVGEPVPRIDVREKVLGTGEYTADLDLPDMTFCSAVRSSYPRARVLGIHLADALIVPGILAIYTSEDVPGLLKTGHIKPDWDVLIPIGNLTHYLGDAICLVVGESEAAVEKAKFLIKVDYEVLEMIHSPAESMADNAPLVHEHDPNGNLLAHKHVSRGDAAAAIAESAFTVTGDFQTPFTEHAFLEPECAVALPDGADGLLIYSSDQSVYTTRRECAHILGISEGKVRVINKLVGGGFGGKEDMSVQHHAALAAYLLKRPVRVRLSRAESILIHPKRHPMDIHMTMGCDENGIIKGVKANVIADTGAYASLGSPVLERACTHAAGPYNYQNFEIDGWAYYTNNPPAGAFRGFGVTQTCFATESLLDELAMKAGISPWEIRYRNAIRPGLELPNGQIADAATGLVETLMAIKPYIENEKHVGLACAMKNAGVGVGLLDYGRCLLRITDGQVHILSGASCIGQGLGTVLIQMVCQNTGLVHQQIVYETSNTIDAPDSGVTSGSRQTLVTGEACRRACLELQEALIEHNGNLDAIEGAEFYGEYLARTDPLGSPKPHPVSHVAYGYATQAAILDDEGHVKKIIAAHDVGKAVNPLSIEGQIEGGVIMSCGFALTERYPLTDCKPTARFGSLGLFRANQVPEVQSIIVEKPGIKQACGAIGIGEITSIPTAPAIRNAYYHFDGKARYRLPLEETPYARK